MKPRLLLALLLGALLLAALAVGPILFHRFGQEPHRPGSSSRLGPSGLAVLHDALAAQPGLTVSRHLAPEPPAVRPGQPRTYVLANLPRGMLLRRPIDGALGALVRALETDVRQGGSRLIILGTEAFADRPQWQMLEDDREPIKAEPKPPEPPTPVGFLGATLKLVHDGQDVAYRQGSAPDAWPTTVHLPIPKWSFGHESLQVPDSRAWYRAGEINVVLRQPVGAGEVFYLQTPDLLTNQTLRDFADNRELAAGLFGAHAEVVFLEFHLDPSRQRGLVALLRGYGLGPAYALLAGLGLLVIWQRSVPLVPPPTAAAVNVLSYQPTAGLEALLRRAVPATVLARTCLDEALAGASAAEAARLRALPPPGNDPVAFHAAAVARLRSHASTPAAGRPPSSDSPPS